MFIAEFIEKYNSTDLFQYTAIDEYSRYRILCGYREHNTYSSSLFLCQVVSGFKALSIEVECVQIDNGTGLSLEKSSLQPSTEVWMEEPEKKNLAEPI